MKKVAIITVNYNNQKDTLEFLQSLKSLQSDGLELKTIVVDNASLDGSVKEIKQKFPEVDQVQTGTNKGFTGGYNKGLEYAKYWGADYFLIINNDTLINSPDLLKELVKTADLDPKIGIVAPKIYFAKGYEFQQNYNKEDLGKIIWYGGGSFDWDNIMSKHRGINEVDKRQYDEVEKTNFVRGRFTCGRINDGSLRTGSGRHSDWRRTANSADLGDRIRDRVRRTRSGLHQRGCSLDGRYCCGGHDCQ